MAFLYKSLSVALGAFSRAQRVTFCSWGYFCTACALVYLLLNYYRIITGANSALFTCPNPVLILAESCPIPVLILSEYVFEKVQLPCPIPVLILAETCPNPVRAKTKKTDYPLPGGMALLFYPSKGIKSEIVASKLAWPKRYNQ